LRSAHFTCCVFKPRLHGLQRKRRSNRRITSQPPSRPGLKSYPTSGLQISTQSGNKETQLPTPDDPLGIWPKSHLFQAQIKNVGKTPARIDGIAVRYVRISKDPDQLSSEPDYGDIATEDFFLLPGSEMAAAATLSPERGALTKKQVEAIKNRTEFLYAYGTVRYRGRIQPHT
jgi:hypothetical protein